MKKLFILFVISTFFMACGGNSPTMPGNSVKRNLTIYGYVTPEQRRSMENSLLKLFEDVRGRGYTKELTLGDYTITVKHDCIDRGSIKVWLERLDSYDGSIYDQDPTPGVGMIYQAERVTPPTGPFFICSDTNENMAKTTRYGAEHWILYANDRNEFENTKGPSHVHPLIPE